LVVVVVVVLLLVVDEPAGVPEALQKSPVELK